MLKARQNERKLEKNPGFGRPGKPGTPSGTKWSSERQHFARFHEGKLERAVWWNFEGEQETHAGSQKNPKNRQKQNIATKMRQNVRKREKTSVFGRPGKPGAQAKRREAADRSPKASLVADSDTAHLVESCPSDVQVAGSILRPGVFCVWLPCKKTEF